MYERATLRAPRRLQEGIVGRRKSRIDRSRVPNGPSSSSRGLESTSPVVESPGSSFPIVGIGASAGGLEAFSQLLHALPADTGMAFVLIAHLDPTHGSMLTEILSRATPMPVEEVRDQTVVEPNRVYVIPPGVTMDIAEGILRLSPRTVVRGQPRTIDHFLQSLAEDQHHRAIGVILSGSATDGTLGLEAIKAEGGWTFAQDDTAQHGSMPKSAVAAGCVDFVLSPAAIAGEIARISRHPFLVRESEDQLEAKAVEPSLGRVLAQLRMVTGVDLSQYKRNTLYRRITRRAVLNQMEGLQDYAQFLQGSPVEVEALFQDVLIGVTSFFRNPEAFEVLKTTVFPALTRDRSRHDPVRVWVLGCSTGEEAYSIAIAFTEFTEASRLQIPLQIFATDLNGAGIEKARAGLYPKAVALGMSSERLRRFFFEADGTYQISKSIRDMVIFAKHNVLTEPPFSRIDLVSCRNLLIYMEAALQQKAMGVMHYALKPNGWLWLGNSETLGGFRDLFDLEDAKHKFYVKKPGLPQMAQTFSGESLGRRGGGEEARRREPGVAGTDIYREADRLLLNRYAPASVLINSDFEVIQFRGDTGHYLAPSPGKASLSLLKMLREGLLVGVRGAIHKARREEAQVREQGLRVKSSGGHRLVDVSVIPVKGSNSVNQTHYLVLFEEAGPSRELPARPRSKERSRGETALDRRARGKAEAAGAEQEAARLGQELAATREYLQSVIEQQEAANEELQSSNEEVQSANEELQSINEELETSREEIESSNEELATVNEELRNRNTELGQANNDFVNLLASVQLAIVMLGPDLRIRRFTPMAEKLLNLIATDVGRPITDIDLGLGVANLSRMLTEVIDTVTVKEVEARDAEGHWYLLRLRPYRTLENRIEGVVLVLLDVDALKRQQDALRRQNELLDQTSEPIFIWELDGGITYWNRGAEETYGFSRQEALGRKSHELLNTSPRPDAFLDALRSQQHWTGELTNVRRDGQRIVVESRMVLEREGGPAKLVFETNHPITERKLVEETLRRRASELAAADRNKDQFLALLAHELRGPLAPLTNALEVLRQSEAPPVMLDRARGVMSRQIHNMARMVDDLLDVSRITRGRIELHKEPVNLLTVVERAAEVVRSHLQGRQQELILSLPDQAVVLEADALRLEQILGNLLNNASKFSARHGHVWLTVEAPENSEVVIRVRDEGIGIAPEHLPKVFEQFMQVDASLNRATGGLGIGLTLVRHLVSLHGGTVEVDSAGAGRGSEFVVRLPVQQRPGVLQTPRGAAAVSHGTPRRILVTDDNVDSADMLGMLLRQAGHDVQIAYSGASALEMAATFRPQVVFLDVGMPGMDGFETARRLRQSLGREQMLLVAVTGYGQAADRQGALAAGFDEVLVKPASPERIAALASHPIPGDGSPSGSTSDS